MSDDVRPQKDDACAAAGTDAERRRWRDDGKLDRGGNWEEDSEGITRNDAGGTRAGEARGTTTEAQRARRFEPDAERDGREPKPVEPGVGPNRRAAAVR